ncbi:transcription factor kayak isoform X3 [Trichogramma pretiosum]|uniref:transcription factor kayak isoform X3 n=1 Tax=Trichogramma pretiosum TaxID=7493 RepID=UPI0006C9AB4A|nr:transcription factor kayak isoform X3 [Trichogramma pretiosum]
MDPYQNDGNLPLYYSWRSTPTLDFIDIVSSFDGIHSGVPTRTTPTLTPTTLRSIEQTFLELTGDTSVISHGREAGFVPPLVEPSQPIAAQTQNLSIETQNNDPEQQHHQHHQQQQQVTLQQQQIIELPPQTNQPQSVQQLEVQTQQQPQQQKRNMGGRRPTKSVGITPEEEERRQLRRERNKMAAARCRKRRMDHTNQLLGETEELEAKQQNLKDEIAELIKTKGDLEMMLEGHQGFCRMTAASPPDIKPNINDSIHGSDNALPSVEEFGDLSCKLQNQGQDEQQMSGMRPNRPNSLPVFDPVNRPNSLPMFTEPKPRPSSLQFKQVETPTFMKTASEVAGIPITTPSAGIPFNFDSLMEGGTGLTPVSISTPLIPTCSSQQRQNIIATATTSHSNLSAVDLSSPCDPNAPKLVSL